MNIHPERKRPILVWLVIIAHFLMGIYLAAGFISSVPTLWASYSVSSEYVELILILLWDVVTPIALLTAAVALFYSKVWSRLVFIALAFVTGSTAVTFIPLFFQLYSLGLDDSAADSVLMLALSGVGPVLACIGSIISAAIVFSHFRRISKIEPSPAS